MCIPGSVIIIVLAFASPSAFGQEQAEKGYDTAMTLGDFQLETGEYAHAIENFKYALAIKPGDAAALVSLGVAYSRGGDMPNALDTLQQALAIDPADERTKYELGIVLFKLGDRVAAKGRFIAVSRGPADETLKAASRDYLDIMAAENGEEKKKLYLDLLGGIQYDSNVILDPDNPVNPAGKQADWRFLATVYGKYRFSEAKKTTVDAGYFFYQSLHNTLKDFNVRQHDISVSGHYYPTHRARYDLRYGFATTLVGEEKYSVAHRITPGAVFNFSPASITEFFYVYENKKFYNSRLYAWNSDRNGINNAAGVSHTFVLSKQSTATVGYAWNQDSTNADVWNYTGNKTYVSGVKQLSTVKASLSASYYNKKYEDVLSRHDRTQEYSLSLNRNLTKHVSLDLSDLYVINDSNLMSFAYTRNIVSLLAVMWL